MEENKLLLVGCPIHDIKAIPAENEQIVMDFTVHCLHSTLCWTIKRTNDLKWLCLTTCLSAVKDFPKTKMEDENESVLKNSWFLF